MFMVLFTERSNINLSDETEKAISRLEAKVVKAFSAHG